MKKLANLVKLTELFALIIKIVVKKLGENPTEKDVDTLLDNSEGLENVIHSSFDTLGWGQNIWQPQMDAISTFYLKYFNVTVDWAQIVLPKWTKERPRLELILPKITGQMMINAYKKEFGNNAVWDNIFTQNLEKNIKTQQARSAEPYAFAWTGEVECDTEWKNKSYNDIKDTTSNLMIPIEGILCALRFRIDTSTMLDQKGLTRFHSLDSDSSVLGMGRFGGGQFSIGNDVVGVRNADGGFRQINF